MLPPNKNSYLSFSTDSNILVSPFISFLYRLNGYRLSLCHKGILQTLLQRMPASNSPLLYCQTFNGQQFHFCVFGPVQTEQLRISIPSVRKWLSYSGLILANLSDEHYDTTQREHLDCSNLFIRNLVWIPAITLKLRYYTLY